VHQTRQAGAVLARLDTNHLRRDPIGPRQGSCIIAAHPQATHTAALPIRKKKYVFTEPDAFAPFNNFEPLLDDARYDEVNKIRIKSSQE
jgi:hypothetical protein